MVIAEGNETPDSEPGAGGTQSAGLGQQPGGSGLEERGRGSEGDLLAERRARRAAETGETALIRRAEAAEATVQTLETHVSSLQQSLREARDERRRISELAETARAAVLRSEHELTERLTGLERRALEIQHGLDAERAARERSERLLESMRRGHRRMEGLVGEIRGTVARLTDALGASASDPRDARPVTAAWGPVHDALVQPVPRGRERAPTVPSDLGGARRGEMADALAAAVERLRARVEEAPAPAERQPAPVVKPPPHKHSMTLLTRWRIRRKQRRSR
jgi:polyhydroxyalkanoate synthesis regulator phasin